MSSSIYNTLRWQLARARTISRDEGRCTVSRLLGGECSSGTPHVHHIRPVSEGGAPYEETNLATVCPAHHPVWEALRRRLLAAEAHEDAAPRCSHFHRTAEARRQCEARMARQRSLAA